MIPKTYDHWKTTEPDDFEDDGADFWCEACQNTGSVECYCGGDQCYCENGGEKPCPKCFDR